jgi:hypothetical protein
VITFLRDSRGVVFEFAANPEVVIEVEGKKGGREQKK